MRSPLLVAACCLCSAYTTLPDGSRWGDAATLTPGWQRLKASAVGYATSMLATPSGDDDSFPSGHASTAAVFGTLTVRDLQSIDVSSAMRTTLEIGAGAKLALSAEPTRGGALARWDMHF